MKRCLLAIALFGSHVYAGDVTFTTSSLIGDGDTYDRVYIADSPPNRTWVTMTGGSVSEVLPRDHSVFEMTGGVAIGILSRDSSNLELRDGQNAYVVTRGTSTASIYDGRFGSMFVQAAESSTMSIRGGEGVASLDAVQNATLNLWGGTALDSLLTIQDAARVYLFGYGFVFDTTVSEDKPYASLSGHWLDGSVFSFRVTEPATYGQIHFVPEPGSLLVLAAGFSLLRRRSPRLPPRDIRG